MTKKPKEAGRIGLIVATHGDLAKALVETTEAILARKTTLRPFSFPDGEAPRESYKRLQALIKKCDQGAGVLIMVDLFGGTPGTLALSMLEAELLEVATGVNLPMALKAATLDPKLALPEASALVVAGGRDAIKEAGALLRS